MSLVNEALRKARQEAARRDAESRGAVPVSAPVHMPTVPRRGLVSPLVVLLLILLTLAVLAVVFLVARQPEDVSSGGPAGTKLPAAASGSVAPGGSAATSASEAASEVSAASAAPGGEAAGKSGSAAIGSGIGDAASEAPTPPARSERPVVAPPPPAVTPPAAPPRAALEPPGKPVGSELRETYRKLAELPDGTSIQLDFIVWSERNPFAQLNGQLVRPGEEVGETGYVAREVEREGVRLEGPAGSFLIRLR